MVCCCIGYWWAALLVSCYIGYWWSAILVIGQLLYWSAASSWECWSLTRCSRVTQKSVFGNQFNAMHFLHTPSFSEVKYVWRIWHSKVAETETEATNWAMVGFLATTLLKAPSLHQVKLSEMGEICWNLLETDAELMSFAEKRQNCKNKSKTKKRKKLQGRKIQKENLTD